MKRDPLDFALWKASKPGEPSWESPWGKGRPGWHIECSAMCMERFGHTLDIHGGGRDLIFPHHENEIAQSEAATGKKPFVRYWLHNGFVNIEKEKMSKSLGNILNIRDALKEHTSEAVRLFLLSSHYRSPIDYGPYSLKDAEAAAERFYKTVERAHSEHPQISRTPVDPYRLKERLGPVIAAMDDDFNTADAVGNVFKEVTRLNRLMDEAKATGKADSLESEIPVILALFKEVSGFLGVLARRPDEYFSDKKGRSAVAPDEIERLIKERNDARTGRDFKKADSIRALLLEEGIVLEDTPRGTVWTVKG